MLIVMPMQAQQVTPSGETPEAEQEEVHEPQGQVVTHAPAPYEVDNYEQLTQPKSNMDLQQPGNMRTSVEYDPTTGYYILHTRIGDVDVVTPYMMTESEYKDYSEQQLMQKYRQQKLAAVEHDNEKKFDITDMKFNIGPADKVFGPGGVQLKLQGSAELLFGFKHQFVDNPSLTERARNNNIFDFDEKIQVNVQGSVGQKLKFNLAYNTEASFSFDQQNVKLAYKGQEDDILQSIEAGNVSLDLNSSLIRGSQALFGVKADMKFGKLKVQALISQQNSEAQTVGSQGGAQMTKFEIEADQYDENKHFFLSYYFRDHYEQSMQSMPYVASGVTINRIEVWVTNKRGNYEQARNLVAFSDLGENMGSHIHGISSFPTTGYQYPDNRANTLYDQVKDIPAVRDLQQVNAYLQSMESSWGIVGGEDYEKVESARMLNSGEYSLNAALGYISLKTALNQDEVLAVAFEYTAGGQVYQVGEFSTDVTDSTNTLGKAPTLILKMLRSSNNAPHSYDPARPKDKFGTWDLMMKNIYNLGASTMSSEKFELYVMYRNDSVGTSLQYLPEGPVKGTQLLRVLELDRLDSKNNPNPDGRFDYVEGYTALSSSGRIIFPVLEPFGSYLAKQLGNRKDLVDKYCFQELYDSTLIIAQEMSEKNKFRLKGKYKGTNGSEIRLNAMNVPRGSVTVTAGGATLTENVDYTVDYAMGIVTILNQSILESGTNVQVKLENQSTFSMQRKGLYGAHLEYQFNKDFMIGGTLMYLHEKALTTKVNSGNEPLSNLVWGVNLNYRTDMQWLSNALDQIPWIDAKAPSTFQVSAEFAQLVPGHTREVGKVGTAYVDDFEATKTSIDVHYPGYWQLSSTPAVPIGSATDPKRPFLEDGQKSNTAQYNRNRALLSWYTVDPIFGHPQTNTPQHIKDDPNLMSDHRTRIVYQQEIYPNKEVLANEDTRMTILNLSFYPKERGPYNISASEINSQGELTNPKQRWGGMMRKLDNTDFEKANIEYIEFWLMDPRLTNGEEFEGGDLYIDLGDISEDILRDGKKSFEHGLPLTDDESTIETTLWGRTPKTTSTTIAFSNEAGARVKQDVGLNGLSTEQEYTFSYDGKRPYGDYVDSLRSKVTDPNVISRWNADPFSPFNDPAGDNYHYYRGEDFDQQQTSILDRYKHYNGTEGNSPESEGSSDYGRASTLTPDIEDINRDNTLNEYEKYFEYHVSLKPADLYVGNQCISEELNTTVTLKNGEQAAVRWYQFKIPIRSDSTCRKIGAIRHFKSIRFMRIYMTGCSDETHLRLATLDLVRGEWRNYTKGLRKDSVSNRYNLPSLNNASMDVQAVSIEENGSKTPVNYVLPPGISRQTDPGQAQLIAQNEQAMLLRVHNLQYNDAKAVYKKTTFDMRNYKRLQMFVHCEALAADATPIGDGDLSCFIRLGSDMVNNYYEYEIPLRLTAPRTYNNDNQNDRREVWPDENAFDILLTALTKAKNDRNYAKRNGDPNVGNNIPYVVYDTDNGKPNNRITVLGNPTLEEVDNILIGIRNCGVHSSEGINGEVWVNELRLSEYNESGGVAAMANAALGISDIAQLNVAGHIETAGYGSIESNVLSRNMEDYYQVAVSAALEMGRLFPEKARLRIPLYASYSNETRSPLYDPLDTDVRLKDNLETFSTKQERDSIKKMSNTVQQSTSFSVTNMKVDIHSKKQDMFYDPTNFSISASYNDQRLHSPELEQDRSTEYKGSFQYSFNFNPKPWEPFKKVEKVKNVKVLSEFNIFYLPQSWGFNTNMRRTFTHLKMRDFNQSDSGVSDGTNKLDITFSKDFTWDRNFDFKYDLTKNMKFTFQTAMNSTVDEAYYTPEIIKDYNMTNDVYEAWKDTIKRSMKVWGTPYTYSQVFTASWNVPFNRIPYIEALTATASYNATYTWNRTMRSANTTTSLGNNISSTRAWQVDGQINFETLYGKSKYWKSLSQRMSARKSIRAFKPKNYSQTVDLAANTPQEINHRLNSETLIVTVTDSAGKSVPFKFTPAGNAKITLTVKTNVKRAVITITTRDPNQRTAGEKAMDFAAYFGTMLRRVQVTYRATNSMTIPGFQPQVGFMGQKRIDGYYAPGFDFAFGVFDESFVDKAKDRGWLSGSDSIVQPALSSRTADFDYKVSLEPFPGFKIQLNGKRYEAESNSIIYSYDQMQYNRTGSFNITQVAIGTAFTRIGDAENNFSSADFNRFLENRDIMRQRVQARYNDTSYPTAGFIPIELQGQKYDASKGSVSRNSADVLVPAFLATYTGRDINNISYNPFLSLLQALPNWNVTFDGLGRLPWIKDHFKSVNLTHAYTCKYAIGSFGTYSTWVGADKKDASIGFTRDVVSGNPVPSSSYDIASVSLTEAFSPLIGLNLTMKNSLMLKFEYRKQRNLTMNITSVQLTEGHTNEFVVGAGYTIKDLNFTAKTKNGGQKKVSNDLKLNVDVSYKNIMTVLRKVEEDITQASNGNKVFALKLSADYVLSQKISLQLFYDHQGTIPLISSAYPVKSDNVGLNVKIMLTR